MKYANLTLAHNVYRIFQAVGLDIGDPSASCFQLLREGSCAGNPVDELDEPRR